MEATSFDHPEAIAVAMGVLDRHLAALNSGDAVALALTLPLSTLSLGWGAHENMGAPRNLSAGLLRPRGE
jgi:hypothetical protein